MAEPSVLLTTERPLSARRWSQRLPGDEEGDVEYAIILDEWQAARASPR